MITITRRSFCKTIAGATGAAAGCGFWALGAERPASGDRIGVNDLPKGSGPAALQFTHFPTRLHAFVWRNWELIPLGRMAKVVGANPNALLRVGASMGLIGPREVSHELEKRSALTVIRRNWHLLPYDQLLALLDWSPAELDFALREDDFLFGKLGSLKPQCEPLRYSPPDAAAQSRAAAIEQFVRTHFQEQNAKEQEPLFGFLNELQRPPAINAVHAVSESESPRFCYSYFALYGDPLLDPQLDPYPDGYLAHLAATGVNGVWLQAVLYKLVPFPFDRSLSERSEERLANLKRLAARTRTHGIGLWLYLNEPRAMPLRWFGDRPDLKGTSEGDHAALCTSIPEVRNYLRDAIRSISSAVPELAGYFTITASENLTNCWSHQQGRSCPRCGKRRPAEVIAEVNQVIHEGIEASQRGGTEANREETNKPVIGDGPSSRPRQRLIVWDWGWADDWANEVIDRLPSGVAFMSVSEWGIPIRRGGVPGTVGEYSISTIGPGARAKQRWERARQRGLQTIAKIQAGNTWELSAVPYIPAVANVAQHAANLRDIHLSGLMLGWTLGGYPSPNLEVVAAIMSESKTGNAALTVDEGMTRAATRRFGNAIASAVVQAWKKCSSAFEEFPFDIGLVYYAPVQMGPANLLWSEPTGYKATIVGFPYDHLDAWRQAYPTEVFASQFSRMAQGFDNALSELRVASTNLAVPAKAEQQKALRAELRVMEAASIHFRSVSNQARFVEARQKLIEAKTAAVAQPLLEALENLLRDELDLARRLYNLQRCDSRLGFEASNQYFYIPPDLMEKALNCHHLLSEWLPKEPQRRKRSSA